MTRTFKTFIVSFKSWRKFQGVKKVIWACFILAFSYLSSRLDNWAADFTRWNAIKTGFPFYKSIVVVFIFGAINFYEESNEK